MSDRFDKESDELMDWAWSEEGIGMIDAKDDKYSEASAHAAMFIVLGNVLNMRGWSRDELIDALDECVFADTNQLVH